VADQSTRENQSDKKPGPGWLFPVAAVLVLGAIGYVSTRLTEPERLADVNHCIGPRDGDPIYENTCDTHINLQYCFFSDAGPERDMCRNTELAPGEGLDQATLNNDLAELGGLFRADFYACELPFVPGQFEHWNTRRMTAGCVSAEDPFAGPHISRPGAGRTPENSGEIPDDL
tara:strand:- start:1342 stop:1860 length:519 start_codon:yes stop_codon:yes gene_type:complete